MVSLRALSLLLLFSGHALAGGLGSALHECRRAPAAKTACKCQHPKQTEKQAAFQAEECCKKQFVRSDLAPVPPDTSRTLSPQLPPAELPPVWLPTLDDAALPALAFAWNVAPPGHGPPVFLKVRSLLI